MLKFNFNNFPTYFYETPPIASLLLILHNYLIFKMKILYDLYEN